MSALVDRYGRVHRDLRISLTDRCSLRCTYCMPADGVPWLARESLLTTEELVRVARVAVSLGVTRIRLTGGEPLLRPDVVEVVSRLARLAGPEGPVELSLTTNGLLLEELARPLVEAGLRRVNVSIDTLRRSRYRELTRRDRLDDALAGLTAAAAAGLSPVKVNAVAMRGVNDDEIVELVEFCVARGFQMRFIEQMPLDAGHTWDRASMVTREEVLAALAARWSIAPVIDDDPHAPARLFTLDGGPATVGVIASVSQPFCGTCDRVRLTADGQVRNCLFAREESDLRAVLRSGADDARVAATLVEALRGKKPGHGIDEPGFLQPERPMSAIGG